MQYTQGQNAPACGSTEAFARWSHTSFAHAAPG